MVGIICSHWTEILDPPLGASDFYFWERKSGSFVMLKLKEYETRSEELQLNLILTLQNAFLSLLGKLCNFSSFFLWFGILVLAYRLSKVIMVHKVLYLFPLFSCFAWYVKVFLALNATFLMYLSCLATYEKNSLAQLQCEKFFI